MKTTFLMSVGLLCLTASGVGAETLESAKVGSGLRFSESGGGIGKGGDAIPREGAGSSGSAAEILGLSTPRLAKRDGDSKPVPAPLPAAAMRESGGRTFWDKAKIGGAVVGGAAGAAFGLALFGPWTPLPVALSAAGLLLVAGGTIGYGIVAVVQSLAGGR